ncbi:hypothetical protein B0J18DRAFT_197066 [Chaetomium sp. MPI-SDFR-AT-0129]|nr:hypothetical protein B0J18DRAFT_197066 [Chaetomium sp. MPI-SDFR-AT-0129]
MMGATTLQPPKTGQSRFSKALPAPPPALPSFEFESGLGLAPLVSEQALPRSQPPRNQLHAPLPPVPPPKGVEVDRDWKISAMTPPGMAPAMSPAMSPAISSPATAKPLNSPLPSLPPQPAAAVPSRKPIARRPVAVPTPVPAPAPAPALAPTPTAVPVPVPVPVPSRAPARSPASTLGPVASSGTSPALASPNNMLATSPAGSISSLLSAYSNHTADSPTWRASADVPHDIINSYSAVSPGLNGSQRNSALSRAVPRDLPPLPSGENAQRDDETSSHYHHNIPNPLAGAGLPGHVGHHKDRPLPPPPQLPVKNAQRGSPRPRTPPVVQNTPQQNTQDTQNTQHLPQSQQQPSTHFHSHSQQSSSSTAATITAAATASTATASAKTGSPLGNGSPQQGELWRRRSLKAEKSLVVPDLKLVSSHGSTAASAPSALQGDPNHVGPEIDHSTFASQPPQPPYDLSAWDNNPDPRPNPDPERLEPAATTFTAATTNVTPRVPPRSPNGGLPGRNIRPVPSEEETETKTETDTAVVMGQETSRVREKLGGKGRWSSKENMAAAATAAAKTNGQDEQAGGETPATVPTPIPIQNTTTTADAAADSSLAPAVASLPETKPIARKAVSPPGSQLHSAKSSPSLAPAPAQAPATQAPAAQGLAQAPNTAGLGPGTGTGTVGARSPMGLPVSPRPDGGSQAGNANVRQNQYTSPAGVGPSQMPGQEPRYRDYPPTPSNGKNRPPPREYTPYSPPGSLAQGPSPIASPRSASQHRGWSQSRGQSQTRGQSQSRGQSQTRGQGRGQSQSRSQSQSRDPAIRTVSETGSIETVKPGPAQQQQLQQQQLQQQQGQQQPTHQRSVPSLVTAALRDPIDAAPPTSPSSPSEPEYTDNPGAALFPRGWFTPAFPTPPTDESGAYTNADIPDAVPPQERHYNCPTRHRYMTANRQRVNPRACRACGRKDREADDWICGGCYVNLCGGCAGALRRGKGDLRGVVKI